MTLAIVRETRETIPYERRYRHMPERVVEYDIERDGRREWSFYPRLKDALAAAFPLAAWPGGRPVAYLLDDCVMLCGACAATTWLADNARRIPGAGRLAGADIFGCAIEEAESDIVCEGCGCLMLAQNRCPEHGRQPDAIMDGDEPGQYVCPRCRPDDPRFRADD